MHSVWMQTYAAIFAHNCIQKLGVATLNEASHLPDESSDNQYIESIRVNAIAPYWTAFFSIKKNFTCIKQLRYIRALRFRK